MYKYKSCINIKFQFKQKFTLLKINVFIYIYSAQHSAHHLLKISRLVLNYIWALTLS